MKIYQLNGNRDGFDLLHDFGKLKPLDKECLLKQLKDILEPEFGSREYELFKLLSKKNSFLIFENDEEEKIKEAFKPISGGSVTERGYSVMRLIFGKMLKDFFMGVFLRYDFPKDLNPKQSITKIEPALAIATSPSYEE